MNLADTKKYYRLAHEANLRVDSNEGLVYLQTMGGKAQQILDVGCGEGTRLATIIEKKKIAGCGVDISEFAIDLAKKQYPNLNFKVITNNELPFANNKFDLVYCAYVLEHTLEPDKLLSEMIRVCAPGGILVVLCPNFGSPNRRSPVSLANPYTKFSEGIMHPRAISKWNRVTPREHFTNPDDDTTIEPELTSLVNYFQAQGLEIEKQSSLWSEEILSYNPRKLAVHILGKLGIMPFRWWGPQIFVAARKV